MRVCLLIVGLIVLAAGCATQAQPEEAASVGGMYLVRSGYVTDVRDVTVHDNSRNTAAPAIGAIVGGVAGSLLGSGSGRALGTLGGAAGGSIAAQQLAQPEKSFLRKVTVRFEDGQSQTYEIGPDDAYRVGDPVKIINHNGKNQLMH